MKKNLFVTLVLFAFTQHSEGQIFIGSGLADATDFGSSALDDGAGFTFQIEKDYTLIESGRLKIHPNINVSFLHSNLDRIGLPSYLNVLSLSPKLSFELVSKGKFKIAPFTNPFASFLLGLQSDSFISESEIIDKFKWGIEWGVRVDFLLGKNTIRFIPVSFQHSIKDFYTQAMISLMVSI